MDKNNKENEQPRNKMPKLSLSLKKGSKRFKKVSSNDIQELSKVKLPKNTNLSTRWAMKNFTDWFNATQRIQKTNAQKKFCFLPVLLRFLVVGSVCMWQKQGHIWVNRILQLLCIHCYLEFFATCVLKTQPTQIFWIKTTLTLLHWLLPLIISLKICEQKVLVPMLSILKEYREKRKCSYGVQMC